ncbi:MAG: hypothetical protein M0Z95_00355 [Actinomycetota bacterium]|jgi:hypothetical protein|nr:hypothetical protein [Actinomycetota bacterium]
MKEMRAEDFDERFDAGDDSTGVLDIASARGDASGELRARLAISSSNHEIS